MNIPLLPVLAALGLNLPKSDRALGRLSSLLLSDVLLIVGVGLAVLLVLSAFVYLWMKMRRRRRRHISGGQKVFRGSQPSSTAEPEDDLEEEEEEESEGDQEQEQEQEHGDHSHHSKRRYKYRVRRRGHRSRNPTLSETGGLPPVKPHEPIKP